MRGIAGIDPAWGVTAVRIATGLILMHAGYQKVSGGLAEVGAGFAKIDLTLMAAGILLFLAGSGNAAIDDVWRRGRRSA